MNVNKQLVLVLLAFSIISIAVFSTLDIAISNSYQRAVTAGFLADFIKNNFTTDITEAKEKFTEGQHHYKIFSGISDWTPLQVILLTTGFLVFGLNKITLMGVPLIISILALMYLYKLTLLNSNRKIALLTVIITAISTFFFYSSAAPLLENGVVLFTAACLYYFSKYLNERKPGFFYLATLAFALGFMYHIQMLFIAPALIIGFFWTTPVKNFFAKKQNYKMLAIAAVIAIVVFLPLIIRETVLIKENISQFQKRTIGRLEYTYNPVVQQSGFLTANDFEFEDQLPKYKRDLIVNRYQLSYLQKSFTAVSSIFYNAVLLPFILLGILAIRWKKVKSSELMILLFVLTSFAFFSLNGVIPRYTVASSAMLSIFAARGLFMLPKKAIKPIIVLVLLIIAFQTTNFFVKIYHNEHIQSMQHDYDETARFLLERTTGPFTIITTRTYQMAFHIMKYDDQKRVYVERASQSREEFEQALKGNFTVPKLLEGNENIRYDTERPPVQYVVVHEKTETGPLRETADYNLLEFLDNYKPARLVKIIDSEFPDSRTWVYELAGI